jgi:hypothetical protein
MGSRRLARPGLLIWIMLLGFACAGCSNNEQTHENDRVAPSRGHLEWSEAEYQRYKARLVRIQRMERFADSSKLIDKFLIDAEELHSWARQEYERSLLAESPGNAIVYSMLHSAAIVHTEAIVDSAENIDNLRTSHWRENCLSRARTSVADLAKSDAKLDDIGELPQNKEITRALRKWSAVSRSLLESVASYADKDEKLNTIVTLEHGQMIQDHISFWLIPYAK